MKTFSMTIDEATYGRLKDLSFEMRTSMKGVIVEGVNILFENKDRKAEKTNKKSSKKCLETN